MKITEIYTKYKILPNLQLHMLRVAGVAKVITDNWLEPFEDQEALLTACLLHDMGNIIKFKLDLFPEFLKPEGLDHWTKVKEEFVTKYGDDEHKATYQIAEEIGVSDRVLEILQAIGFSKALENTQHNDHAKKIACYSDQRVTPFEITSLQERINQGKQRFATNKNIDTKNNAKYENDFHVFSKSLESLEVQIFVNCKLSPEEINDNKVNQQIILLKELEF